MILTDYYKFEHLQDCKSKMRVDLSESTLSHPAFETLRNKQNKLFLYFGNVPDNFSLNAQKKADKALTKVKNISSIYVPNVELLAAFGDCKNTADALLFRFSTDYTQQDTPTTIEIFVARGQKNNRQQLYYLFVDGELDSDILELKSRAKKED
ncbi:MAG: hypothetical protein P4L28_04300 [Paludibacteraceae bacterium]|nr:hypothetical protein [Paludibacteraceae bacterium]